MKVKKILSVAVVCLGIAACLALAAYVEGLPLATFRGHTAEIFAVVVSTDGNTLASVSEGETIKLWDVATQKERANFRGSHAAMSPDGKTLAWTQEWTIRLWDVVAGEERLTLWGHADDVCSVAFSPDGKTLASASGDTLKLWHVATGKEQATLKHHSLRYQSSPPYAELPSSVYSLAFSPDGKTLASGGFFPDVTIKLWDVTTAKELATLPATDGHAGSLAFSPNGKTLATGTYSIWLWDVTTGTKTATLGVPGDGAAGIAFSPDGKTLAAVSMSDPAIFRWDIDGDENPATFEKSCRRPRPRLLRYFWDSFPDTFKEHACVPLSVLFTPEGKLVALGYDDRDRTTVMMWRVASVPSAKR